MTTRTLPEATCTDCGRYGPIKARGRCTACYTRAYRSGALDGTIRVQQLYRVPRSCLRCSLPTVTEERICLDCSTVLRRIAEPSADDAFEAEWVRVGMVWKPREREAS